MKFFEIPQSENVLRLAVNSIYMKTTLQIHIYGYYIKG